MLNLARLTQEYNFASFWIVGCKMSLERTKVTLEFTKALAWPLTVVSFFLIFSGEISGFIERLRSFEALGIKAATSGTGEKDEPKPEATGPKSDTPSDVRTDVWFDFVALDGSDTACIRRGQRALKDNGYKDGGVNFDRTAFAYDGNFVAAVSCERRLGQALLLVSGPSSQEANKRVTAIVNSFRSE